MEKDDEKRVEEDEEVIECTVCMIPSIHYFFIRNLL